MDDLYQLVKSAVNSAGKILLVSHRKPDADTLGAALALKFWLEKLGKEVTVACVDKPAPVFKFLPGIADYVEEFNLEDFDLRIIDEVVKRIAQRNKKVDTENQRKKKDIPANVYFTISRSQYRKFTPLLLQGCLHDKNRTRLKKYWKDDGSRGSLLMLDLALAFQRGAILKQKAVNIFRNDLKKNAKDGYSSCQDFDLSQFSLSSFVD